MGWQILRHSVALVLRSPGAALRVSAGPMLLALLAEALLTALGFGGLITETADGSTEVSRTPGRAVVGGLLSSLVFLAAFSWAAVAWHRYVLREEVPGLLPPLRQDLMWPYAGRSLVIAVVVALIGLPLGFALALVLVPIMVGILAGGTSAGPSDYGTWQVGMTLVGSLAVLPLLACLGWIGTRLSLTLPARAMERPISFGESWAGTSPASGAIFVASLIIASINLALSLLFEFVLGTGLATDGLDLVVRWATTMLGISILTTLHGHLVEHRPLTL